MIQPQVYNSESQVQEKSLLRCSACRRELADRPRFCPHCGQRDPVKAEPVVVATPVRRPRCRGCGIFVEDVVKFCPNCGMDEPVPRQLDDPRRRRWQSLENVLESFDKLAIGGRILPERISELGKLYGEILTDLAFLRSSPEADLRELRYLETLALRAYARLYDPPSWTFMDCILFFLIDFPRLLRVRFAFILVALLIFASSALVGWLCIDFNSKLVDLVVPKYMQEAVRESARKGDYGDVWNSSWKFDISSRLMFHNIQVAILAFATGALCGVGTFYFMAVNGMLLGGLAAICQQSGVSIEFWSLILPHGIPELLSIMIAGGAGLVMGYAVLAPGRHRRGEWFRRESSDAVRMLVGTVPLFIVAALIETWITPAPWPTAVKYLIALINMLLIAGWFWWANQVEIKKSAE